MSAYISELNAALAREQLRREQESEAAKQAVRELTPLEDRLDKLLATIPIEQQRAGLALSELRVLLRGRQGRNAHCGELGEALRRNGFVRRRVWGREGEAHPALWFRSD